MVRSDLHTALDPFVLVRESSVSGAGRPKLGEQARIIGADPLDCPAMDGDNSAGVSGRRVTVDEAARALGLSVDAVRKRVQRGQIAYEKDPAGRVRIILDEAETLQDESQDTTGRDPDALLTSKDETIRLLREQLEQAHERDRENRRIIAALTSRIPAIEAPETPVPSQTPTEASEAPDEATGAQEPERRSWWRRVFGG